VEEVAGGAILAVPTEARAPLITDVAVPSDSKERRAKSV